MVSELMRSSQPNKTDVLRDGDEFGCGDTITFTFDHSDALFDFFITVEIE